MDVRKIGTTNLISVSPEKTVREAALLMKEYNVGTVVAVKIENGVRSPVGFLTDRDITLEVVAKGMDSTKVLISQIMVSHPVCAYVDEPVEKIVNKMKDHKIRRIPLLERDGHLVGILAEDDLVRYLVRNLEKLTTIPFSQIEGLNLPTSPELETDKGGAYVDIHK